MSQFNALDVKERIVEWIRDYFKRNGPECSAVIGISGGKDSTVAAALCVEALGKDRVIGVLMPNGVQSDLEDSIRVVESLDIKHKLINIKDAYDGLLNAVRCSCSVTQQMKINIAPRLRMTVLYAVAQSLPRGGRVVNTCNRSEDFVGYSTKFGDSAGDFSPLCNLTVSQVKQVGYELPVPKDLIDKVPSDGLCGKTDEDNLGFSYENVEDFIMLGTTGDAKIDDKIKVLHDRNLHKLLPMPAFRLEDF